MTPDPSADFDLHEVTIRPAREEDFLSLRGLYVDGLLAGSVPENDTGADMENISETYFGDGGYSGMWVACYKDEPVGMVGVLRMTDDSVEIRRLRVMPEFQRMGIGSLLMREAIGFCQRHGYLKVLLDVRAERAPAIAMFERVGFRLNRRREIDNGRVLLDFYLDLYREPGI